MKKAVFSVLAILILVAVSCNPVEKVLTTPEYFRVVKDTVLARGYCVNDTVIQTHIDTVETIRDTTIRESFPVYLTDECDIDTNLVDLGLRFTVRDGVVTVNKTLEWKDTQVKEVTREVVKDRSQEKVLRKKIVDLNAKNISLAKEADRLQSVINQYRLYIAIAIGGAVVALILFRR